MKEERFDIGLFDLKMQPIDGMQLLREARVLSPEMTVVMMTAHGSIDSAVEAMKLGAFDYLQKPFELSELQQFVEKVYDHHRLKTEVRLLRKNCAAPRYGMLVTGARKCAASSIWRCRSRRPEFCVDRR